MSIEAYLLAVRNALRTHLDLGNVSHPYYSNPEVICEIMPDGKPAPIAGMEFWSVHPSPNLSTNNTSQLDHIDERCDLSITYTRRTGPEPYDRLGQATITTPSPHPGSGIPTVGVLATARAAAMYFATQSNAYAVMNAANTLLGNDTTGFVEPMRFKGMSYLGIKGYEWFPGDVPDEGDAPSAIAVEIRLGDARRVQETYGGNLA